MKTNLTIIHGDDNKKSREYLLELLNEIKSSNRSITKLDAKYLKPKDLESSLKTSGLFEDDALLIEGLLSRPRSKEKTSLTDLIVANSSKIVVLWEPKKLTSTSYKSFSSNKPIIKEFKLSTSLFSFIDNFRPNNKSALLSLLDDTLKDTPDIVIFTLLGYRISDLIIAKDNPSLLKTSPWQRSGIISQSKSWSLTSLKELVKKLNKIDYNLKTGATNQLYSEHLKMIIFTI